MRKTKIVCTIGPQTCRYDQIEKLAESGMNVARLNMSHGDHEWHKNIIKSIRAINGKGKYSIALMLDTKGPEIRSGDVKKEIFLKKGDQFIFTVRKEAEYEDYCTEVSYDGFIHDVSIGDTILIDGGIMNFLVKEKTETDIICECLDGGALTSRRHLNIRGKSATLPSITEKDWVDIEFGIEEGFDFLALSFIKEPGVITDLKQKFAKRKISMEVIAKIESADSIPHLEEILKEADGAMVARGDLGAEVPIEEVPLLQQKIIEICRGMGKPVIVATHFLESMIVNPTPTRAEVTDIAEAVKEGADAIMLSGETAAGKHPFKAIAVMDTVAKRMEKKLTENKKITVRADTTSSKEQIVMSASIMANNLNADAMVVITRRGFMAALLSRCRPNPPIFAFTNTPHVRRKLNIYWGIHAFRIEFSNDPEKTIQRAITALREQNFLKANDRVIVVSDILAGEKFVETIQIRKVE